MKILGLLKGIKSNWEREYAEYKFIRSADALFFSFPKSYKTRRGKVGGYMDYLEQAEIDFLAKKVIGELDKMYGFSM